MCLSSVCAGMRTSITYDSLSHLRWVAMHGYDYSSNIFSSNFKSDLNLLFYNISYLVHLNFDVENKPSQA